MRQTTRILAGAMSGTSADGVDVALVRIDGRGLEMTAQLLHHHARPYPRELSQRIHRIRGEGHCRLDELAQSGREISIEYAEAVSAALAGANLKRGDITAIAAHGQTLFHSPPNTIQWFDPSLVAACTGCSVISDFRRADLAAGGQGAPLVPFADYVLYRCPDKSRALLNIGGIANITILPAGCTIDDVAAFDTGPGNCISDWLCRTKLSREMDEGGELALKGQPVPRLIDAVMSDEYFRRPPPKSTDGPAMIGAFARTMRIFDVGVEDLLASAVAVAARAIARSTPPVDQFIATGGGVHNRALMQALSAEGIELLPASFLGIQPDEREAIAFALLGAATLDSEPSNVPSVTGAKRRVVLGSITPKP